MNILEKIEFYLASEEAITGIMALLEKSPDISISAAVLNKTAFRLSSFIEKAKNTQKLINMINLRTKRMTKIDKLIAWLKALENENFHDEAGNAYNRLRELGYTGAV